MQPATATPAHTPPPRKQAGSLADTLEQFLTSAYSLVTDESDGIEPDGFAAMLKRLDPL